MLVYVINKDGNPLMPCKPAKARHLLNDGKAKVIKRTPFTIQLLWDCEDNIQNITLGVDSGYTNIGLSAITDKDELFSAEVKLRTDIVKLNSERRMYRRNRRSRNTRYRQARFLNRKKPVGRLAPSIQHKLDSHIKIVNIIKKILPITNIIVEVAAFDIQKIKDPDIIGTGYQDGQQLGFSNIREYVLYRDNHKCQHCKGKSKDKKLQVHHIVSRQVGSNRPDNLITLCSTCHDQVSLGKINFKVKVSQGYKAEAFMNMVRLRLVERLRSLGNIVSITYGYITKVSRIELGLPKSHTNDAFVIADGNDQVRSIGYLIQQVRECNRKLYKGIRSHIRNTAPRVIHGFQRYDKVLWRGIECFIFGRRTSGYFDIRSLDGTRLNRSVKYTELKVLESFKTILIERRVASSPA